MCAHPQRAHLLCAGASDGSLFLWDTRKGVGVGPAQVIPLAHSHSSRGRAAAGAAGKRLGADVWGVQFGQTAYGELLSCGADGSVQAWSQVEGPHATPRVLVQLHLPVNALHISEQGYLAAASDAEQLTFIDLHK